MFKLSEIKTYDLFDVFQINPDINIEEIKIEELNYVLIDNFFKKPELVIEFLKCFPVNNSYNYLEKLYEENQQSKFTSQPGIQQLLPNALFEKLSGDFYKLLVDSNYIPENNLEQFNNPDIFIKIIRSFSWHTNILFPDMVCNKNTNTPHVNQFEYFYTVSLTDNLSEINFYKLIHDNKFYPNIKSIINIDNPNTKDEIAKKLNKNYMASNELIKFSVFEEDENFVNYHSVEQKFNQLLIFRGDNWHNLNYKNNHHYSLDCCFTEPC